MKGILYVTATPIGNLEDITPRAIRILSEVDIIAAEDTRHSRNLLTHFGIKAPLFSCHKFNEGKRGDFFVTELLDGKNIALISDAGTPCISDPGNKLVTMAVEAGVQVVPVCGVSAVISALSVSGFNASAFAFIGFLPRTKAENILKKTFTANETIVFYESPKRILSTVSLVEKIFPNTQICLCNDISKKFEKIYRGTPSQILEELSQNAAAEKGEYTCVINYSGGYVEPEKISKQTTEAQLVDIMIEYNCTLKDASRKLHEEQKLPKKEIYAAMLRLKELF